MSIDKIDNGTIVQVLYKALLDRGPEPRGFTHHVSILDTGEKTLYQVGLDFVDSPEFTEKYNRTRRRSIPLTNKLLYAGHSFEAATAFAQFQPPPTEADK